jgi:hypothetical protein
VLTKFQCLSILEFFYGSGEAEKIYNKEDNPNIFACSKLPAIGFSGILCSVATLPPPQKKINIIACNINNSAVHNWGG